MRMDIAGRDVTERLQYLMRRKGYNFDTSAEFEVCRQIKENACVVSFQQNSLVESVALTSYESSKSATKNGQYQLPDGSLLEVHNYTINTVTINTLFTILLIKELVE